MSLCFLPSSSEVRDVSWGQESSLRMAVPCLQHWDGETGGTLPAAPLRRFFFSLCHNQDACQQTLDLTSPGICPRPETEALEVGCLSLPPGACWTAPDPAFHPSRADLGGISGCAGGPALLCLKMRSTRKLPFLCSKEDIPASWATPENHRLPLGR